MSEKDCLTPLAKNRLPDPDNRDAVRFCPKCGKEIPLDRNFCAFCENEREIPRASLPRPKKMPVLLPVLVVLLLLFVGMVLISRGSAPDPEIIRTATSLPRGTAIPVLLLP